VGTFPNQWPLRLKVKAKGWLFWECPHLRALPDVKIKK